MENRIIVLGENLRRYVVRSQAAEQQQRQQPKIFDQAPSTCAGMKYAGMVKSLPPMKNYVYMAVCRKSPQPKRLCGQRYDGGV